MVPKRLITAVILSVAVLLPDLSPAADDFRPDLSALYPAAKLSELLPAQGEFLDRLLEHLGRPVAR